jgi:hypothetical protein
MSFDQESLLIGKFMVEGVTQVAQCCRRFGRKLSRSEVELDSVKRNGGTLFRARLPMGRRRISGGPLMFARR